MIKISKIEKDEKENIIVSAQKTCQCAGQVLKYPPRDNGCFYDCIDYNQPRWFVSKCQ